MADGHSILAEVRQRFGVAFSEVMTGGGCMALEARLESGHWLVATDEGLCSLSERIGFESGGDGYDPRYGSDRAALGWFVGVYPDEDGWMGGAESVVEVVDYDAYAAALPDMVEQALAKLAKLR